MESELFLAILSSMAEGESTSISENSKETFAAVQQELARRADLLGDGKRKRVYSGKHPFSGMLFCGECGDLFSRVIWTIHGRKQIVWRCMTRMQSGADTCGIRYVDEDALQAMVVKAVNKAFTIHQSAADTVIDCVDEALNEELTDQAAALDEQIRTLQLQLMGYRTDSPEVERIGGEIIRLRNQKDELLSQTALSAQRTKEIRDLAVFFDGLSGPLTKYDEIYVRRLLSRITVFEDRLVFTFKDGKEVTIKE